MRIDHHAYQRATRVAGLGFGVQFGIGMVLLIFGLLKTDTAILYGSLYILLGLLAWLGLIVIFNQHKLERLEALEEDELAATRAGAGSVFERADEEIRVAGRRLRLMHKWLMPGLSLFTATALTLLAWLMLRHLGWLGGEESDFHRTDLIGWAVAICLAFAATSFIVSRFVAGMAKQSAWQNLRGGAAFMVGNSLVTLAIAIGIGFRFFKNDQVVEAIAWAIPAFMCVLAIEIVLNFVLNLYRPRIPGETPRPAFDSKLLSMFAAPDNLVKSINEMVNYQFGFDVTSSWGYQLLLRSFVWLIALGVAMLFALNMIVIVEPHEQAIKLSRGEIVGEQTYTGTMWKAPWPFQSAEKYDVTRLRELHLTAKHVRDVGGQGIQLWKDDLSKEYDRPPEPFIVVATPHVDDSGLPGDPEQAEDEDRRLARTLSLINAEIVLQYRIREADGGLLDYLHFASDTVPHRQDMTMRDQALRALAQRVGGVYFTSLSLDDALTRNREHLGSDLQKRVQMVFDARKTGVEIVAVNVPMLQPAGGAAGGFEDLSLSHQDRQKVIAEAGQQVATGLTQIVGQPDRAESILAGIDEYNRLVDELGPSAPETIAQRVKVQQTLVAAGGEAARRIAEAERDRWVRIMGARAQASRIRGQLISYEAAPRLYRQRELMRVYATALPGLRKYVLGIDPSHVSFDIELKELNPLLNIGDAFESEGETGQ